ncbi:TetR/AcrR family transcriptional regulator [Nocardioides sp. URHA0020]|uniref:TetR/AcrR family transcriptional regulator n=1 Tax=Nocardioides sp. URHA0020 TaxID=1380392 RepID=UPI0018CC29E6|nr:TetR/AcrR family transcriptional regulator [Nocardioides sp. URHA0020]
MSEKQTRRRGPVLEQAILDAAWSEVAERGWSDFTIAGIAERSGTAKAVIYRRWRNRVDVAEEMLRRARSAAAPEFVSSGALRADLVDFLEGMAAFLAGPFGEVARGVICETDGPSQTSLFAVDPVIAQVAEVVSRAVGRGELCRPPSALAMNVGHAVLMAEFLQSGNLPGSEDIAALVDDVWLPALGATRAD